MEEVGEERRVIRFEDGDLENPNNCMYMPLEMFKDG